MAERGEERGGERGGFGRGFGRGGGRGDRGGPRGGACLRASRPDEEEKWVPVTNLGLGVKCSKEVATAIRGAIILAKLSVIPVRRGCWGNKIGYLNEIDLSSAAVSSTPSGSSFWVPPEHRPRYVREMVNE